MVICELGGERDMIWGRSGFLGTLCVLAVSSADSRLLAMAVPVQGTAWLRSRSFVF